MNPIVRDDSLMISPAHRRFSVGVAVKRWSCFVLLWAVVLTAMLISLPGCNTVSTLVASKAADPNDLSITYHYTDTEDQVTLGLRRYQDPKRLDSDLEPVILCHGLSYNLYFWDLTPDTSLARYLARQGYDVWCVSLRGAVPSSQSLNSGLRRLGRFNLDPEVLKRLTKRTRDFSLTDWSVDDHIRYDVPTTIGFVLEQTGHDRVHWVGHSMGGMVFFGWLEQADGRATSQVRSFVAAAVPMTVFHPLSDPYKLLADNEIAIDIGSRVVGSSAEATIGSLVGNLDTPTDRLFFNADNVDRKAVRNLFYLASEEIAPSQLKQLLGMVKTESFTSLDGQINYTEQLDHVTTPTYFIVGTVDNMATPAAVKYAYRRVAGTHNAYDLFGVINGHKNDYGHDDLLIGRHARDEVFPKVLKWLRRFELVHRPDPLPLQPRDPATPR